VIGDRLELREVWVVRDIDPKTRGKAIARPWMISGNGMGRHQHDRIERSGGAEIDLHPLRPARERRKHAVIAQAFALAQIRNGGKCADLSADLIPPLVETRANRR